MVVLSEESADKEEKLKEQYQNMESLIYMVTGICYDVEDYYKNMEG